MNKADSLKFLESIGKPISSAQYDFNTQKTVVVGMSGGVDSSVSALIIKMQGYKTIGIFMKNWEEIDANGVCSAEEDYEDVVLVAERIGIPYYTLNLSQEYRDNVFDSFVEEYRAGYTPNPDILCNREIKFKVFYERAIELGADYLATGHYCQNIENKLVKGVDRNKDQTYFLYTMQADVLKNVMFPIGNLQKNIVRDIAKKFELNTYNKKDSTGICFIGERNFKKFLSQYIASQKGNFINLDNQEILGVHDGMCFYTPGQRKGMGIGGPGGPWFVAKKDVTTNTVYVVEGEKHTALFADSLKASEISWVGETPSFPLKCTAKIRYRQQDQECIVTKAGGELIVNFSKPQRAISLRQSIVFYKGEVCLGGAIICEIAQSYFELEKPLPSCL